MQTQPIQSNVVVPSRRVPHKIVGAGVILDRQGRVLIARRLARAIRGGLWEFPGGSVEPGEDIPACIRRELREELAIETEIGARLCVVHHTYSHLTIELHAHFGRVVRGRPRALQCAAWAWEKIPRLRERPFSGADLQVISALGACRTWPGLHRAPVCGM